MSLSEKIYQHLKRKTNTVHFIPQIDGLRFLAIAVVVLVHFNNFVVAKVPVAFTASPLQYHLISGMLNDSGGRKAVLLFFVISGFILSLPFAKHYLQQGKPVELKKYFLRRLTRLEPPYILNMLLVAVLLVAFGRHDFAALFGDSFKGVLPGLAASLVYMHNIIFPNNLSINEVAWSLEIEVQFYILVPLLVTVFKLRTWLRRAVLVFLIALFTLLQHLFPESILTIYGFIQYFLVGFLLTDLYLSEVKLLLNPWLAVVVGLAIFIPMMYINVFGGLFHEYAYICLLAAFSFMVLTSGLWSKIFTAHWLTAIGGMCYSIYLWHDIVISGLGNHTIFHNFSRSYPLVLLWQMLLVLPAVLVFCTGYYLLIERPCMDKDWPKKLWAWVSNKKFEASQATISKL